MKKLITIVISVILLAWLFPFFWLFVTSIQLEQNVISETLRLIPESPTLQNYINAFEKTNIFTWLLNSLIISVTAVLATLILDTPIAYALARIPFKGRNIIFWIVMAGMMIPFQVLIIPLYIQFNSYQLINTFAAAILPRLALPIGIFIMKQFFEGFPLALEEAAFLDGANRFTVFFNIIIPLGKTAIVTVTIISFINTWNDFLWPLIVLNDTAKYPITVGIANFQGTHGTEYSLIMAGAMIASLPQFIMYALFRKKIVAGLAMTGIKG